MTLGKPGVAGNGPDTFNRPTDIYVAPNGDISLSDGHGGDTNARIVKFSKDGKFIKAWGKEATGRASSTLPHASRSIPPGRLFVGDRSNNRIQIFDQDGKFIAEWKQFGRPSGVFIDKNDMIYVGRLSVGRERQQPPVQAGHPHRQRQGRQGHGLHSRPRPRPACRKASRSTMQGIIYAGWTGKMNFRRFVKK